jgi:hypothetical protein
MPTQFVLELRQVSSLTQARFAAGEGFTHIRLAPELVAGPEKDILEIKAFLSGVAVGLDASNADELPPWADYYVHKGSVVQRTIIYPEKELPPPISITEIADLAAQLPDTGPKGLSLPGLEEEKLGHASYDAHQDFLESIRSKYAL